MWIGNGGWDGSVKANNDNVVAAEPLCINIPSEQLFRLQERLITKQEQAQNHILSPGQDHQAKDLKSAR